MCSKDLFFIFCFWSLCSISAQNITPKPHELHRAAVRAYQVGQDRSSAELSRQVLIQQPNHCASGSLIISAAIRGEFCRPDLIRMTQQLMGNGCNDFQSHADLILALLYNDRAKEAGFALEQMHRRFPRHPELQILEAELAIGMRRFDPLIEALGKITGTQPSPDKVSFALRRLDRVINYFLDADSSKAEETLNRLLIRHTAKREGKVLFAIWAWHRKRDPAPLSLYFATYPEEIDTYTQQYLPWLFIQTEMATNPNQAATYLKNWTRTDPTSTYYLIHAFLQRKLLLPHAGTKKLLPWVGPKLVSFLEPYASFPNPSYPAWFWDWTDTLTLAKTLFKASPTKKSAASLNDLLTAYEFTMRQDSISQAQLLPLLKRQCEAHPIFMLKEFKKRQAKQDSVVVFATLYETILQFVPDVRSGRAKNAIQFRFQLKLDSIQSNLFLSQLIKKGQVWAAAGYMRITEPSESRTPEGRRIQDLLYLITQIQWGKTQGYLPGLTEANLVQNTRKNTTDSLWINALDELTSVYGFSSLVPHP